VRGGRADNLELAIDGFNRVLAVRSRAVRPLDWAQMQIDLGNAYASRLHGNQAENLERAIDAYQQALSVFSRDISPLAWAQALGNLGNAYASRIQGDREANLTQAIDAYQQALSVFSRETAPAAGATVSTGLGNAYYARTSGDRAENLEQAIDAYQQAVTVRTAETMPLEWAQTLINLANAYAARICGDPAKNLEQAIAAYWKALNILRPDVLPAACLTAAGNLASVCSRAQRWNEAAAAYQRAVQASERLYQSALSLGGREAELVAVGSLYRRAAYAMAKAGDLQTAVLTLEHGRARQVRESLARDRADLAQVQRDHPDLYAQYQEAVAQLQRVEVYERDARGLLDDHPSQPLPEAILTAAEQARAELHAVTQRIRQIDHFADFLTAPGWRDLAVAVQPGRPLVYLAPAPAAGLALIVHRRDAATELSINIVWLPGCTGAALHDLLLGQTDAQPIQSWLGAYLRAQADRRGWLNAIERTTGWLWQHVMGPIIEAIQAIGAAEAVLIPGGVLALLPIHAAWTERQERRVYALDEITFSYAPSAQLLAYAQRTAGQVAGLRLLAIEEPQPVSADPLPGAHVEAPAVAAVFPSSLTYRAHTATREAVLAALPAADVLHCACHARAELNAPLLSGLLLANDAMLTVQDVLSLNLSGARLATLSACETGMIGTRLPDEVVALPLALLRAGFAGVAASLWAISDLSTAMLMERFYRLWQVNGLEPSAALRQAQLWLRDTTNGEKKAYYQQHLPLFAPEAQVAAAMPAEVAAALYKVFVLEEDDALAFTHPYFWAAFHYIGV
jgi:CHAT domain-containing protein